AATIKVSLLQQVNNLLALCETREFSKAARGLQDLAATVKRDRAKAVVLRRAGECAAAALVFDRVVKDLAAGKAPGGQIAADDSRWRVLGGDASSLRVRTRGQERTFAWKDVPAGLFIALLERGSEGVPHGALGVAVAALGTGRQDLVLTSLQTGYEDSQTRALLDAFVAGRVRKEALPEGGYLVASGELLTRKEHFRRQEEATIAKYRLQLEKAHAAIKSSKAAKRMAALRKRKDKLDKLRAYALELIYDTKKYFYPYRARTAEYIPVQREVDARVDAVREVWDDSYSVTIKLTPELKRALEQFDQAAKELTRRIVDVEEAVEDVAFRRAYLGQKFNVRNFFRTPVERELLAYSREVMEDDAKAEGDIKGVEREQVRVTNEYRIMFGRWPVRIVEPLVLSSRGHCEEMSKLGYFGHFSPTPGRRTPYERMALQGYKYGASENCVGGTSDPTSAHVRWCHSSGHHRNLLMAEWTEMGTGAYSSLMTQNFGRAPRHSKLWPKESAGGAGAGSDSYDDDAEGFDYDDDGEDDMEDEDEDADLEDEDEESVLEEGEG
ncbi:MAG: CAP domain-containing protein, partial [Planctomycetota bacterium]